MAKINITGLDVESLLDLREKIDAKLGEHKRTLEKQLGRLGLSDGKPSRGRRKSLKGRKVAPKYRSRKNPSLTWAGPGATPLWMRDEMKAASSRKTLFLDQEELVQNLTEISDLFRDADTVPSAWALGKPSACCRWACRPGSSASSSCRRRCPKMKPFHPRVGRAAR